MRNESDLALDSKLKINSIRLQDIKKKRQELLVFEQIK